MNIEVIKKDGSTEPFDQNKIARVTKAAGLTAKQAQALARKVAQWAQAQGEPQVTTREIRGEVIGELRRVNKYAASLFTWYETTKKRHLNNKHSSKPSKGGQASDGGDITSTH